MAPVHARREWRDAQTHREPAGTDQAEGLAHHESSNDAQCHRGGFADEAVELERDTGISEGKEGDDHKGDPAVQGMFEPLQRCLHMLTGILKRDDRALLGLVDEQQRRLQGTAFHLGIPCLHQE